MLSEGFPFFLRKKNVCIIVDLCSRRPELESGALIGAPLWKLLASPIVLFDLFAFYST